MLNKVLMYEVKHWTRDNKPKTIYCLADNEAQAAHGVKTVQLLLDGEFDFIIITSSYEVTEHFLSLQTAYKIEYDFRVKKDA